MKVVFLQGLNMTGSSDSQCVDSAPRTQIPSDATLRQWCFWGDNFFGLIFQGDNQGQADLPEKIKINHIDQFKKRQNDLWHIIHIII